MNKHQELINEMERVESYMHQDDYDDIIKILVRATPMKLTKDDECSNCGQTIDWKKKEK